MTMQQGDVPQHSIETGDFSLEAFSEKSPALGSPRCRMDNLHFTGSMFGIRFGSINMFRIIGRNARWQI
jgi:hypothetical protein